MKITLTPETLFPVVVWGLYIASLFFVGIELDAFEEHVSLYHDEMSGLSLLLLGWLGIHQGCVAWLANPFFIIGALMLRKKPCVALILATIGFCIALTCFTSIRFWVDEHIKPHIGSWGPGCYLWLSSYLALMIAAAHLLTEKLKNHDSH